MGGGLPSGCGKLGERWEINAKAQKGKGAKGGGEGRENSTRRRGERGGGILNTVARGEGMGN
jgi:hypothetical protein